MGLPAATNRYTPFSNLGVVPNVLLRTFEDLIALNINWVRDRVTEPQMRTVT